MSGEMICQDANSDMQTDAEVDKNSYRNKLLMLDNDLTVDNIMCLKFLCLDKIPLAKLSKITEATQLFELLEYYQLLAAGNWYFLAECLEMICRKDLSSKVLDNQILKMTIEKKGSHLKDYRKMLFDVCEDLDEEDVSKGIYYYGKVPKSKRSGMRCGMDFIGHLEQVKEITEGNLTFLKEFLNAIGRMDLLEKVLLYEKCSPDEAYSSKEFFDQKPAASWRDLFVDEKKAETDVKKQPKVNEYSQNVDEISKPLLIEISHHLSNDKDAQEKLSLKIGYTKEDLQKLKHLHPERPDEVVLTILTKFFNQSGTPMKEKKNELLNAFEEYGQTELANCLRKLFTKEENDEDVQMPPADGNTGMAEITHQTEMEHENIAVSKVEAQVMDTENHPNQMKHDTAMRNMEELTDSLPQPAFQMESYRLDRKPRGICLIIDNENFRHDPMDPTSRYMKDRNGSHLDRENLRATFAKLDFIVEDNVYRNLSAVDMVRVVNDIAININHKDFDCFVACILSHGTKDHVYGADGKSVPIRDLTGPLKSISCPSLLDKPKLFFIQACQGQDKQRGTDIERDSIPDIDVFEDTASEVIPNEADFLLGMATIPGFVSYRSKTMGSWYITKLCEVLNEYAYRVDLLNLLTIVNLQVGQANADLEGGRYKQSPAPFYTLRKRVQFM